MRLDDKRLIKSVTDGNHSKKRLKGNLVKIDEWFIAWYKDDKLDKGCRKEKNLA